MGDGANCIYHSGIQILRRIASSLYIFIIHFMLVLQGDPLVSQPVDFVQIY